MTRPFLERAFPALPPDCEPIRTPPTPRAYVPGLPAYVVSCLSAGLIAMLLVIAFYLRGVP